MKINNTSIIIGLCILILLVIGYYWRCCSPSTQCDDKEGFQTQQNVETKLFVANNDSPTISLGIGSVYFDPKYNIIVMPTNGNEHDLTIIKNHSVIRPKDLAKNLFVETVNSKSDYEVPNIMKRYLHASVPVATTAPPTTAPPTTTPPTTTTTKTTTAANAREAFINTKEGFATDSAANFDETWTEYDMSGVEKAVHTTNPFLNTEEYPLNDNQKYYTFKFTLDSLSNPVWKEDGNLVCTYLVNHNEPSGLIVYDKSSKTLVKIISISVGKTGQEINKFDIAKPLNFTTDSFDLSTYSKATSEEQSMTFSAIVSKYDEYAALQPITDSIFFDPLAKNFITIDSSDKLIIQNLRGEPVIYENALGTIDSSTISPWSLIDQKNKVIIVIRPNTGEIPIQASIISYNKTLSPTGVNADMLYFSHKCILHTPNNLEKVRDDRNAKIDPNPILKVNSKSNISAAGSYGCVINGIRYYSHNLKTCVLGTYDANLSAAPCKNNPGNAYTETYDLSMNVPVNHVSDYYKWMWYWKSKKFEEHAGMKDTSDYILKSSVVPPVCPTCPACPAGGGVCNNCGGNGGSGSNIGGSTVKNIKIDTDDDGIIDATFDGVNKVISGTIDTVGKAAGKVADKVGDAAGKVTDKAGDVAGKVSESARGAVGSAWDAGKGAIGEVWGAGKGAMGEVWDTGKNAAGELSSRNGDGSGSGGGSGSGSGSGSGGGPNGMRYGASNMGGGGVNTYVGSGGEQKVVNPAISNMNYFGKLPAKGDDKYIPVTANFSSFGR